MGGVEAKFRAAREGIELEPVEDFPVVELGRQVNAVVPGRQEARAVGPAP